MRIINILIVSALLVLSVIGDEGIENNVLNDPTSQQFESSLAAIKISGHNSSISLHESEKLLSQPAQASTARPWQDIDPKTLPKFRLREQHGPRCIVH
jgi:hypothetical protein